MNLVTAISDAGDAAVLIPLAALLVVVLWRYQGWKAAWALMLALAACACVTVILKLVLVACGQSWNAGMSSPSGHASMSVAVYGALGIVFARQSLPWQQPAIVLGNWVLIAAIAVSRVVLGAHSYTEVALGLLVGGMALALFAYRYFKLRKAPINRPLLAASVLAIVVILHGAHLPAENLIRQLAFFGRASTGVCAGG